MKSGLNNEEFQEISDLIIDKLVMIEKEYFEAKIPKAKKIMINIDLEDSVFIALALSLDVDRIWSDDAHFKKQDKVKVFTTREVLDIL